MEPHIKSLLLEAQKGNQDALNEIVGLYQDSVYWKALSIMHNDADAKDIVQETFLLVHRNIMKLQDVEKFYSWLMIITVNRCNISFRKNRHIVDTPHTEERLKKKREHRNYMNPQICISNEQDRILLEKLIENLPEKQAEVIKLMYFDGLKLSEISTKLQVPVGTVKTRAARGREELKKKVEVLEHREGRKLSFQVDVLFPVSMLGASYYTSICAKANQLINFCTTHVLTASVSAAIVVGSVVGGAILLQPQQENQPVLHHAIFTPIQYNEQTIVDARTAYYTCLNFGYDEASLQKKSKEDIFTIKPVYEKLKESGSPYYNDLRQRGWTVLFESMISD